MVDTRHYGKDEPAELRDFRDSVRRFAEAEIRPRAAEAEATGQTPGELFSMVGELGWLGINLPESVGGGADKRTEMVFIEQLRRDGRLYTITEGANDALTLNMARVLGLVDRD